MDENITNGEVQSFVNGQNQPSIDELQQIIMQKMAEDEANSPDYFDDFESAENLIQTDDTDDTYSLENEYFDISPNEKKYVISIMPDLVPYFDDMSQEKRAALINQLVANHMEEEKHLPEKERISKLVKHSIVVFITIAIGMPLIFFLTNASIEATVNSYREIQSNFEKLYQQKGGVKRKDLTKIRNLKY